MTDINHCTLEITCLKVPLSFKIINDNGFVNNVRKLKLCVETTGPEVEFRQLTENEGEPFPPKSSNLAQDVLFKAAKKIRKKYEGVVFIGPNSCHNDKSDRCDKSRKVVVIEDPSLQTVACLILEDLHTIVQRYRANISVKTATIYDKKGLSATADWVARSELAVSKFLASLLPREPREDFPNDPPVFTISGST